MKAERGKVVSVHYRLTGDDGDLLDSSEGQEPLTYLHGYDGLLPGLEVAARSDEGTMTFRVVEVSDDGAVLDGNHPLAGRNLHFEVDVLEVRDATAEEIAHGHVHGAHDHDHDHA